MYKSLFKISVFTDNFNTNLDDGCLRKFENMILMREIMVQFSLKAFYNDLNWLKVDNLYKSAEVDPIRKNNAHCEFKVVFAFLSDVLINNNNNNIEKYCYS